MLRLRKHHTIGSDCPAEHPNDQVNDDMIKYNSTKQ